MNASFIKLFFGFCLITSTCFGQNRWEYSTIVDEFEGELIICYVTGVGSEYPYNHPQFRIDRKVTSGKKAKDTEKTNYEKFKEKTDHTPEPPEDSLRFYLSDVPSAVCDMKKAKIKFDTSETIFLPYVSTNTGGEIWRVEFLYDEEFNEFINLLKTANSMVIRLSSDCLSGYSARFSLIGSTEAINYLLKK